MMEVNLRQIVQRFIQAARPPAADGLEKNFLEELVRGFDTNPKEARRAMRKLLAHDNLKFFASACGILREGSETSAHQYLIRLLFEGDFLPVFLADVRLFSTDAAVALATDLVRLDPLLDFKLMRLLFQGESLEASGIDTTKAERVLEIVEALPKHTRILPLLLKLLRGSPQRLHSRVALLFCQVSKNPQWAEQKLADDDPEVRASVVEGLWGCDSPGVRAVLRAAVDDHDERVVANAIVGLCYVEGKSALTELSAMAADAMPRFRAAAASAMGRMLDERMVALLTSMVRDPDPQVRSAALRALLRIRRQAPQEPGERPAFPSSLSQGAREELLAAGRTPSPHLDAPSAKLPALARGNP